MLDKAILDTTKTVQGLVTSIKGIEQTNTGAETKQLTENMGKLNTETEKLNKLNTSRKTIDDQIKKSEQDLVKLYDAEAQQLAEVKLELQERRAELKKTAKDNKVAKDSIVGLNIQLSKLRKTYDQLSKKQRENVKVGGVLLKQIDALDRETKQLTASTGRFQKNVGNYPGLFNKTTFSLKGLGTELLAAGGVIGGVQLLVQGFKAFTAQVSKNIEVSKQLSASFNLNSRDARAYASDILAISDTFDQDYNEVTQAAIATSKELGIGIKEATGLIEEGFLKGSNNSGEFLDILKEYPVQFKKAGLSAEETFAVINQQVTQGVYSDKGVDAIKEGTIQLTEWTKAVSDSLTPLGENIKLEVERLAASGKSFEAMQLISSELKNNELAASEVQAIMSTVFRGAGEDAESFVLGLSDLKLSLDDVAISATESEQASLELNKSWNDFVASVADSDSIFSKAWSAIKRGFADVLGNVANEIEAVTVLFTDGWDAAMARLNAQNGIVAKGLTKLGGAFEKVGIRGKEASDKVNEAEQLTEAQRKVRFAAWQRRQAEIERANNRQIQQSAKRIEATSKQIEKVDEFSEGEDEALALEFERQEALTEKEQEELDKRVEAAIEANEKVVNDQLISSEKQKEILQSTAQFAADELENLIASGELSIESFGKFLITTTLDLLEKQLIAAIAAITFKEAGTKGLGALITIPILTGLVKGAFSLAKNKIQSFATGTESVDGPGTETSDSIPAMLSKNERVVPANVNKLLGGIPNDELPNLVNAGMALNNGNLDLTLMLAKNNQISQQMLKALHRGKSSYNRDGMTYLHNWDGSNDEMFKDKN
jgi:hypothetical protein